MSAFLSLPDLASHRLGGSAIAANDEFFAPKENLLLQADATFEPGRYTDRGKWMDGWETRRRREPGNDWCVVRLGVPGVVRGVVVDTAHFRGNHPESASVDGVRLDVEPARWDDVAWEPLVPRSPLAGDAKNTFGVAGGRLCTHVRLSIFPDGGVARLRVHGEPVPDWEALAGVDGAVEVAAIPRGGSVVASSDAFFGAPHHLLLPDDSEGMWDGWETRRRRGPGNDWVVIRLGHRARIERIEIDTRHFKGNYPESARVEAIDAEGKDAVDLARNDAGWREILQRYRLGPDRGHVFEPPTLLSADATHLRLSIYPDGGVARLRVYGSLLS
ncbi:MAG TPA: allantoicase [Gemmatimonadota bacterium]|jgi:allantoicase|nr:allantoicase [Gemmatimonadota bacterium]